MGNLVIRVFMYGKDDEVIVYWQEKLFEKITNLGKEKLTEEKKKFIFLIGD